MRDLTTVDFDWDENTSAGFEAASVVDRGSSFEGTFRSHKDLRVEGELKGTIACDGTLFVAEGAVVSAMIDAEHVTVAGDVHGEVRCRGRLQILPSGRVRARVATGSLVIQEGAIYEGELDMAGMERTAPRPLRTRSTQPPVSIEAAAVDRQGNSGSTFIRRLGSPETTWESGEGDGPADSEPAETPTT
jgi:cytoskeletal protein CcmA (bactofilin family)